MAPLDDEASGATVLGQLLASSHVAVVGATDRSFTGTIAQRNLRAAGFAGRISQLHPRNRTVDGMPCVARFDELASVPETVMLLAPPPALPEIIREAEAAGTRFAVIPGAGEADAGSFAHELESFLRAPERRIRVLGPNCMGVIAVPERMPLYIGSLDGSLQAGPCALISQSGAVVEAFATQGSRLGFRLLLSTGNETHITCEDAIEFVLDDGQSRCLLLSLEGVKHPARFLQLLGRAADAGVRVAIVRAGRSERARAAALSHTGSISGDWELWAQLARRQGAAVLDDLDALCAFGSLASGHRQPRSRRTWIVTNSGGQGAQLADLAADAGLSLPQPSASHRAAFATRFPAAGEPANPMDLWALDGYESAYRDGIAMIEQHAEQDATLVASIDGSRHQGAFEGRLAAVIVGLAAACSRVVPVHLAPLAAEPHPMLTDAVSSRGVASLHGGRAGIAALGAWVGRRGPRLSERELAEAGTFAEPGARIAHADALALLEAREVRVPRTVIAARDEPLDASSLRAPLVLKAIGPPHRAKVGGIRLGVLHDELAASASAMARQIGPSLVGFEVAEFVCADLELLVHLAIDPQLGPRATLGVGGALAEQASTAVCDLAPCDAESAVALLERLYGPLDESAGWVREVARVICVLARALRAGEIAEIEINPLAVDRLSGSAWAVDVLACSPERTPNA